MGKRIIRKIFLSVVFLFIFLCGDIYAYIPNIDNTSKNNMCMKKTSVKNISIKNNELDTYITAYRIEIDVEKTKMYLYELNNNLCKKINEYTVSTVKKGIVRPKGIGIITKIELDPWWYPTDETKRYLKDTKNLDIPNAVPPRHKLNFMGTFKMHLSHKTSKGDVYRIHGNNDEKQIGKRVTGGCVRMYNNEGEELSIKFIQAIQQRKKIEVEFIS